MNSNILQILEFCNKNKILTVLVNDFQFDISNLFEYKFDNILNAFDGDLKQQLKKLGVNPIYSLQLTNNPAK